MKIKVGQLRRLIREAVSGKIAQRRGEFQASMKMIADVIMTPSLSSWFNKTIMVPISKKNLDERTFKDINRALSTVPRDVKSAPEWSRVMSLISSSLKDYEEADFRYDWDETVRNWDSPGKKFEFDDETAVSLAARDLEYEFPTSRENTCDPASFNVALDDLGLRGPERKEMLKKLVDDCENEKRSSRKKPWAWRLRSILGIENPYMPDT